MLLLLLFVLFLLLFGAAAEVVDAALDVFLFLFFLVVALDLADAAADVAFLFLVPPEVDEVDAALRDFLFPVASSLLEQSRDAERAGIPRWMQILDPGIGFAKDFDGNLKLLKHCGKLRSLVEDYPILLGPSRKGFIGMITGESIPAERDYGTAAACLAGIFGEGNDNGCTILRVHNVRGIKQAAQVIDAIQRQK